MRRAVASSEWRVGEWRRGSLASGLSHALQRADQRAQHLARGISHCDSERDAPVRRRKPTRSRECKWVSSSFSEPCAIRRNWTNEPVLSRPWPSAILAAIDAAERRICDVSPNISSLRKLAGQSIAGLRESHGILPDAQIAVATVDRRSPSHHASDSLFATRHSLPQLPSPSRPPAARSPSPPRATGNRSCGTPASSFTGS